MCHTLRRPETWLLLSTAPVDLRRLWRGGPSQVETLNIIFSPTETLKTTGEASFIGSRAASEHFAVVEAKM